jgi:hypothetical protein
VTPCCWAFGSVHFEGTHCFHIQVQVVQVVFFGLLDPDGEDTESYKMSVTTYETTQHHIPEGLTADPSATLLREAQVLL